MQQDRTVDAEMAIKCPEVWCRGTDPDELPLALSTFSLLDLPNDLILHLFSYCSISSLGALASTCTRLHDISNHSYVWRSRSQKLLATNQLSVNILSRSSYNLTPKEKCRINRNWLNKRYYEVAMNYNAVPVIPWLFMERDALWYSSGSDIRQFPRCRNGSIIRRPKKSLSTTSREDLTRFVVKNNLVIAGSRGGELYAWHRDTGKLSTSILSAHQNDVLSLDLTKRNTLVTGSKDETVKVWSLGPSSTQSVHYNQSIKLNHTLIIGDRVWSVAADSEKLIVGSAGVKTLDSLTLFDLMSGCKLLSFGSNNRRGAGIFHAVFEDHNTILSGGYDTSVCLWDVRSPDRAVIKWEDPHDSAIYCVESDHRYTVISGTNRHGLVRLWDKRVPNECIQYYYIGRENSPVYCLTYDPRCLYVALDRKLSLLDFSIH